jgi:hypothetical protein
MDEIKKIKEDVLRFMQQEVSKYGNGRMDTKEIGELADVVKDLAEAEYYCSVAEAMGQSAGYSGSQMGYGGQGGSMSYQGQQGSMGGRSGYGGGSMGHTDPMQTVRELLADPEMRTMIRNEVMR